jgi:hypothetical protein
MDEQNDLTLGEGEFCAQVLSLPRMWEPETDWVKIVWNDPNLIARDPVLLLIKMSHSFCAGDDSIAQSKREGEREATFEPIEKLPPATPGGVSDFAAVPVETATTAQLAVDRRHDRACLSYADERDCPVPAFFSKGAPQSPTLSEWIGWGENDRWKREMPEDRGVPALGDQGNRTSPMKPL